MQKYERNGILLLLMIILILTLFKDPVAGWFVKDEAPAKNTAYTSMVQQIEAAVPEYNIQYPDRNKPGNASAANTYPYKNKAEYKNWKIEVNSATAEEFKKLYGIGDVLSARIVKFREGLGGFQSLEQIRDVYGIQEETFLQIRPQLHIKPAPVRQLNINEADLETLSKHPYIPPTLAKQFIGYRTKVKPFDQVDEVRKLYYLRDHPGLFEKLSPYLTVN